MPHIVFPDLSYLWIFIVKAGGQNAAGRHNLFPLHDHFNFNNRILRLLSKALNIPADVFVQAPT
jgi:hypothetical protein